MRKHIYSTHFVVYVVLSFTITVGQDFTLSRNKVTFDLGANDGNSVTVLADILDDCLVEGTECFTLSGGIGSPAAPGAVFVGDSVTICITDNDSKCVFVWSHATAVSSIISCGNISKGN